MLDQCLAQVAKYITRLYTTILGIPPPDTSPDSVKEARANLRKILVNRSREHILRLEPTLRPSSGRISESLLDREIDLFCRARITDLDCVEMYERLSPATSDSAKPKHKLIFEGPIRPDEEMAVKQFMLDAYHIDRDQSMKDIEARAAALASDSAGKEILPSRIRTVWGRIVTEVDNEDLVDIRRKLKDHVYHFVKAKQCLELFRERDRMQPRVTASR